MKSQGVPSPTSGRSARFILLLALLNAAAASSIYLSILPGIVRGLDLTEVQGGLLVTTSAIAFGVMAPWWGRKSDRAGRVPIITLGLVGYAITSAAFALGMELGFAGVVGGMALYGVLLISRPLGGALAAAVPGTSQAYLAETSTEEERTGAVALVGIASGLGSILGPAIGGGLATFGLTVPLWTAAVLALVVAVLVHRRLPEPVDTADMAPKSEPMSWRDPRPRPLLVLILVLFTAIALLSTTMGFLFQDRLDLDDRAASTVTGAVLAAIGIGIVLVQVLVVQRYKPSPTTLLTVGLPVTAMGIVVLLGANHVVVYVLSGLILGAGGGFTISGAIAAATLRVGASDQGALGGLTVSAQVLGFIVGPLVGAVLYQQGQALPGVVALVLIAASFVWVVVGDVTPDTAGGDASVGAESEASKPERGGALHDD